MYQSIFFVRRKHWLSLCAFSTTVGITPRRGNGCALKATWVSASYLGFCFHWWGCSSSFLQIDIQMIASEKVDISTFLWKAPRLTTLSGVSFWVFSQQYCGIGYRFLTSISPYHFISCQPPAVACSLNATWLRSHCKTKSCRFVQPSNPNTFQLCW